ncbi:MAG TPA: hypothetical protein VFF91_08285, partial [Pseudoxanthomonas sp.]|nr:hypothetical protein [Pseudoxanthomonas sp.]
MRAYTDIIRGRTMMAACRRRIGQGLAALAIAWAAVSTAQAATFTDTFDTAFATGTTVNRVLGGQTFSFSLAGGDGGDMAWDDTTYAGNPGMSVLSGASSPAVETLTIARSGGAD